MQSLVEAEAIKRWDFYWPHSNSILSVSPRSSAHFVLLWDYNTIFQKWERYKEAHWNGILTCFPIKKQFALFSFCLKALQFLMLRWLNLGVEQTYLSYYHCHLFRKKKISESKAVLEELKSCVLFDTSRAIVLNSGYTLENLKKKKNPQTLVCTEIPNQLNNYASGWALRHWKCSKVPQVIIWPGLEPLL